MIKKVVVWDNGMTMVFDEKGQQVPEQDGDQLQGYLCDVRANRIKHTNDNVAFSVGKWKEWTDECSRDWIRHVPCQYPGCKSSGGKIDG